MKLAASLVVINSRWDLHPQGCAHAGRTTQKRRPIRAPFDRGSKAIAGYFEAPLAGAAPAG